MFIKRTKGAISLQLVTSSMAIFFVALIPILMSLTTFATETFGDIMDVMMSAVNKYAMGSMMPVVVADGYHSYIDASSGQVRVCLRNIGNYHARNVTLEISIFDKLTGEPMVYRYEINTPYDLDGHDLYRKENYASVCGNYNVAPAPSRDPTNHTCWTFTPTWNSTPTAGRQYLVYITYKYRTAISIIGVADVYHVDAIISLNNVYCDVALDQAIYDTPSEGSSTLIIEARP